MSLVVCPECFKPGYLTISCKEVNGEKYCYWRVEHVERRDGKKKKRTCTLGPVGRDYIYVERVHKLGLTNILQQDTRAIIINAVTKYIETTKSKALDSNSDIRELVMNTRKLRALLERLVAKLRELELELENIKTTVEARGEWREL